MAEQERDSEVRYLGDVDVVEVAVPEEAREPADPRHERVPRGATFRTTAEHAAGLVLSEVWEWVSGDRARDLIVERTRAAEAAESEPDAYARAEASQGGTGEATAPVAATEEPPTPPAEGTPNGSSEEERA